MPVLQAQAEPKSPKYTILIFFMACFNQYTSVLIDHHWICGLTRKSLKQNAEHFVLFISCSLSYQHVIFNSFSKNILPQILLFHSLYAPSRLQGWIAESWHTPFLSHHSKTAKSVSWESLHPVNILHILSHSSVAF